MSGAEGVKTGSSSQRRRSSSCGGSSSSSSSDRYHLASADITPESVVHAYYVDGPVNQQGVSESADSFTSAGANSPSVSVGHVPHLLDDRTRFSEQQEGHGRIAARTVTATIVDPSALDAERGADFAGSRPIPIADNPARMSVRNVGASSYDSGYNSRQQPQPTLAALALADRCGQLAPELGYYPPHRVLTDFGQSPGFYSEPASGAGSPNSFMSDGRVFVGRGAVSADNTLAMSYGSSRAPSSTSALGVMFSAPAAAMDPMAHARGMRYTESTIATAARSPAMSDVVRGSDMHTHHHFQQHRSAFSSASSPQAPDAGKGFYSGDESSQPGASRSQLSVLPENSSLKSFHGEFGGENNRRLAQSSTEFAPHASSSPSISAVAASLTAASSSFSFRNSQTQFASSHILPMQQPSYSSSNRHSTATSTTASRDSMFLRLKEKMKYFKPRSRPHSDNFADRRSAAGVPHGSAGSQPLPSSILGSPPLNKANRGNSTSSETQLFGMSLGCAVKVAGVHVGIVADSGESCVVPTVVAVCGRHLCDQGQQMQGIFRVNGSMKRVQKLQDEFCEQPHYGRHIEWAGYTLHDAATILRRYLISLPESVISAAHYNAFLEKLTESVPDSEKARDYALLICQLTPESRHTLLYMLELLSVFARQDNCTRTLMNASNLAAVLQPCLLVHPGQIANPHEYGKAKEVVEFLIAHASELHTSSVSSEHRQDSYSLQQQQPPPVDGQMVGTDGFVIVGQDGLSRQGGFGAGLIVAGPRDDGSTNHGNIETSGPNALAPKVRQAQPYEHWQSAITRDSGLTTVNSADSVGSAQLAARQHDGTRGDLAGSYGGQPPMATSQDSVTIRDTTPQPSLQLQQGLQTRLAVASDSDISRVPPAPRGDSVIAMNMTLSTPVLNAVNIGLAQTVRPLGSVTARFFDPTAVPESGGGNDDERHLDLANFQQQLRLAESPGETGSSFSQDMPSAGSPFMGSFTSWPSNRSSMALSSVQYQYTRSPMTPPLQYQRQQQDQQRLYGSNAQINERPGLNSGDSPRPRRSQSFAVPVSSNEGMGATSPHARLEAKRSAEKLSSGAISNPGVIVQARRGTTGDRRAGSIALSAGQGIVPALSTPAAAAADSPQPRAARPLPTIPLANTTRAATEITQSLHNPDRLPHGSALPASKTVGAIPRGSQPLLSSVGGGGGGAFSLYPLPQAGRARGASSSSSGGGNLKQAAPAGTARIATRSPAMQYGSSGPGHVPAQRHVLAETAYSRLSRHGGPNSGNAGRASWLSEDVPEDELVRGFDSVTGVSKDPATGVNNIRAATASDRAHPSVPYLMNRYSEAQQHKLHPIERPEQMPISSQAPAPEQGKHAKLQRSAAGGDAARDKVSMTRLKNIFRIKNGGNSSGGGDELERPMPRELVHSSASAATSTGARQYHYQESSHSPSLTS
ncbi:GTPase activating protein (GAP) for Rho1p, partial [Coemansia thaxteri]